MMERPPKARSLSQGELYNLIFPPPEDALEPIPDNYPMLTQAEQDAQDEAWAIEDAIILKDMPRSIPDALGRAETYRSPMTPFNANGIVEQQLTKDGEITIRVVRTSPPKNTGPG